MILDLRTLMIVMIATSLPLAVTGYVDARIHGGASQERSPECKGPCRAVAVLRKYRRGLERLLIFLVFAARVVVAVANAYRRRCRVDAERRLRRDINLRVWSLVHFDSTIRGHCRFRAIHIESSQAHSATGPSILLQLVYLHRSLRNRFLPA